MDALTDFETKVDPAPARLAIGFTSQWKMERGRIHMAGTRGPLSTHVLAREGNPQVTEPERLEYLIHELGHFLGAAHSPERNSVMRPVLGDKQAGRFGFHIQFDPVNTLAIAIISDEMRRRNLTRLAELSPDTRKRLGQIYTALAHALPDDPAAFHYAQLVRSVAGSPVVLATRQVLQQIVHAAIRNQALPPSVGNISKIETRRESDALTEYYVREAARAAQRQPENVRHTAFLTALAIGMNDVEVTVPSTTAASFVRASEQTSERMIRLKLLGDPTVLGRRELARRFFASALLATTANPGIAEANGVATELSNARTPLGFSFANIAADRAGVRFAQAVQDNHVPIGMLALAFNVRSFMPDVKDLPEKLTANEFAAHSERRTTRDSKSNCKKSTGELPSCRCIGPKSPRQTANERCR